MARATNRISKLGRESGGADGILIFYVEMKKMGVRWEGEEMREEKY